MRVAVVGLSAVLMSGCSWLGGSGGYGHQVGYDAGGAYDACAPQVAQGYAQQGYAQAYNPACSGAAAGYGAQGYGAQGYGAAGVGAGFPGAGYAASGAYGAEQYAGYGQQGGAAGYGAGGLTGYGQTAGYGQSAGVGYQGAYGVPGQVGVQVGQGGQFAGSQGFGAFGNGSVQTLGAAAPYGTGVGAVYGQNVVGSQYAGGQFVGGAVQTVQGAPIYVPEPYGVPVGVGVGGGVAAAALPWGLALLGGTDFDVDGDVFSSKAGAAKLGNDPETGEPIFSNTSNVDGIGISYDDAFDPARRVGLALERDLGPGLTLLGQAAYSNSNGNTVNQYTTVQDGTFDANGVFTPGVDGPRALDGEFGDLNTYTAELGLRKYVGKPTGIRPYVAATGGVVYNEGVDFAQRFSDDGTAFGPVQEDFIDSGWNPTASGLIGLEAPVGRRGGIGIESGVRWTDGLDTVEGSADDRISIPVTIRGRVAF